MQTPIQVDRRPERQAQAAHTGASLWPTSDRHARRRRRIDAMRSMREAREGKGKVRLRRVRATRMSTRNVVLQLHRCHTDVALHAPRGRIHRRRSEPHRRRASRDRQGPPHDRRGDRHGLHGLAVHPRHATGHRQARGRAGAVER